jgi:hypothetical protein
VADATVHAVTVYASGKECRREAGSIVDQTEVEKRRDFWGNPRSWCPAQPKGERAKRRKKQKKKEKATGAEQALVSLAEAVKRGLKES